MKKLLVVYNICGISGRQNIPYYIDALLSIWDQTLNDCKDYKIAVSSCMSDGVTVDQLIKNFGRQVSYNLIHERQPLSVTFNHTVDKAVDHFGEFEAYLYIDSGINFWNFRNGIELMWNYFKTGKYAIVAAMPSNDHGLTYWKVVDENEPMKKIIEIPVGKTTNMHCQIFGNEWRKAYGKILPDIFANDSMESVYSYFCAALRKKYMVAGDIRVLHVASMDGPSSGFSGRETKKVLYLTQKSMNARYDEGKEYGFGYQECWKLKNFDFSHNPEKFDENGFAIDDRLLPFLKKEMFLDESVLNYHSIKHDFYGGV